MGHGILGKISTDQYGRIMNDITGIGGRVQTIIKHDGQKIIDDGKKMYNDFKNKNKDKLSKVQPFLNMMFK